MIGKCNQSWTVARLFYLPMLTPFWEERAAELVEFGLVVTFVIAPMVLGLISMARAFNTYEAMQRAAREGARVALARSCGSCGDALPTVTNVENAVLNALTASSLQASSVTIPSQCTSNLSTKICYERDIVLNSGDSVTELGVVVGFTYPLSLNIPFTTFHALSFNVSPHVQMREEN